MEVSKEFVIFWEINFILFLNFNFFFLFQSKVSNNECESINIDLNYSDKKLIGIFKVDNSKCSINQNFSLFQFNSEIIIFNNLKVVTNIFKSSIIFIIFH